MSEMKSVDLHLKVKDFIKQGINNNHNERGDNHNGDHSEYETFRNSLGNLLLILTLS